ncbi:hypothetical protein ACQZ6C_10635 [Rhizobium rhizogenes]
MANTSADTNLPDSYLAKTPFDKTRLVMVPRSEAADAAHLALFQLQDLPRTETMMAGVGVLFAAFCSRTGLDPQELHAVGMAILKERTDGDIATGNSLQVLRDFAAIRVMGEQTTFY